MLNQNLKSKHSILGRSGCAIFMMFALHLIVVPASESYELNMVTYYPAPEGIYDRLSFTPPAILATPCTIGALSTDPATGKLIYCRDNGAGIGIWGSFSSVWTQAGNYVYADSTISSISTFVGIGTSTPVSRLTLDNDGGILALGTFGSGQSIANFNYSTDTSSQNISRLIWYPKRAIFRAMTLSTLGWPSTETFATDDAYMGDYSVSFGYNNNATGTSAFASGSSNGANWNYTTIAGGSSNFISANYSTILAGRTNSVSGNYSTTLGLWNNVYNDYQTALGGAGFGTYIYGNGYTILGAVSSNFFNVNAPVDAYYGVIIGGNMNSARGRYSIVGGGISNSINYNGPVGDGDGSTLGGGSNNLINADSATILGGYAINMTPGTTGIYATAAGGGGGLFSGTTSILGPYASSAGGMNHVLANVSYATSLGGYRNTIQGAGSTTVGYQPTASATATYSVVTGANNTTNGVYSWASGRFQTLTATANRSFVWGYATSAVSTAQANSFVISSGKMGIGDTTPSAILSMKTSSTDDYLALTSTNAATSGDILMIKNNGYVGIGKSNPQYPLDFGNGAFLDTTGVFNNASSRTLKENIKPLNTQQAIKAALKLDPVIYNYKVDQNEEYVGFIAEDVPDFVATKGRKSVSDMNVTAVLTAVVKEQKNELAEQEKVIADLKAKVNALNTQSETMVSKRSASNH